MTRKRNGNDRDRLILLLGIVAIVALVFFAQTKNSYMDQFNQATQNNNPSFNVGMHLEPNTVCAQEATTWFVESNMPQGQCTVYYDAGTGYKDLAQVSLNFMGQASATATFNAGTVNMKAICVKDNGYSTSNQVSLTVNQCQQPNQPLTCEQKAQQMSAYYIEPKSSGQECVNHATVDCQQMGKTLDGYVLDGTCCYYTCTAAVPQPQDTCTDSDGGQDDQHLIIGTVTDPDGSFTDYCWGDGRVAELYCENGDGKLMLWQCEPGWTCEQGKCEIIPCEEIMSADEPSDCEGHPTSDGGICSYWAGLGCLSSFG